MSGMPTEIPVSILDAIHQRRSTRTYTKERVPRALITRLLDAAVHAPTAMHREPWAFVVVQNPALLERICERAKAIAQTPRGAEHRLLADPSFHIFHTRAR